MLSYSEFQQSIDNRAADQQKLSGEELQLEKVFLFFFADYN